MSAQYSRDHCKIAVAKVLQTLGWHSINSTPLEVLTDILSNYIQQISKITHDYANEFGQTEANLDHLGLAFQEMGITLTELEEYTTYVNFLPAPTPVPKFPIPKESNLNFLKPGSKEVVTRPVHINEHLPPMYPLLEGTENEDLSVKEEITVEESTVMDPQQFKKPADPSPKMKREEESSSRPTREISSVMMTTSGFLSPAREGKLPESKAPAPPPPPPIELPPVPPPVPPIELPIVKKRVEKKKEKAPKDPSKAVSEKKAAGGEHVAKKTKQKQQQQHQQPLIPVSSGVTLTPIPMEVKQPNLANAQQKMHREKMDKALAAAKAKTLKLNTTITPIPPLPPEKLLNEPDKKKVDIFKKISNKPKKDSRSNTPSLIVDEATSIVNKITHLSSDITIEPINPNPDKMGDFYLGDNSSPPVAPKTPDIVVNSPPKPQRKRKETTTPRKPKRPKKTDTTFLDTNCMDFIMERPKTPDVLLHNRMRPFPPMPYHFPLLASFGGPGLIPPQMFPFSQFGNLPSFPGGKNNPYFPPPVVNMPPQAEPVPLLSPKSKESLEAPKVDAPPQTPPQPIQVPELNSSTNPVAVAEATPATPPPTKNKEHKKEKKDKIKKKNKKDKDKKDKLEKKKLKELAKKDGKEKPKKKKKDKNPESAIQKIILKVNSPSPRPETPESTKKLNIKPVKEPEAVEPIVSVREPSPSTGLAKISALVTGPPKPKTSHSVVPEEPPPPQIPPVPPPTAAALPVKPAGRPRLNSSKPKQAKPKKVEQPFKKIDEMGNEVWICPACGQQDDGRPMIGCDGCDAWYHWVCVGIQVPPDENENWYCKPCLCRKNEDLQSDKKRKRKRKEKKEH